jgi:hypothetical protein
MKNMQNSLRREIQNYLSLCRRQLTKSLTRDFVCRYIIKAHTSGISGCHDDEYEDDGLWDIAPYSVVHVAYCCQVQAATSAERKVYSNIKNSKHRDDVKHSYFILLTN